MMNQKKRNEPPTVQYGPQGHRLIWYALIQCQDLTHNPLEFVRWTEQSRAEQSTAQQSREQNRTEQNRTEQNSTEGFRYDRRTHRSAAGRAPPAAAAESQAGSRRCSQTLSTPRRPHPPPARNGHPFGEFSPLCLSRACLG